MSSGDRLLTLGGFIMLILGIIGSVAPILPGSLLSLLGLLMIHRTQAYQLPNFWIIIFVVLVILATIIDYYLPVRGTKKYGGTKSGIVGSSIGIVLGIFIFPPLGMIIGPFLGAFVGEYLGTKNKQQALRSAWGSFVGFLLTSGIKLIIGLRMLIYAIQLVW